MSKPVVAITMGDPAGVGPEVCLRAVADPRVGAACVPVIVGDRGVLARVASAVGLAPPPAAMDPEAWTADLTAPAVVDMRAIDAAAVVPGEMAPACGRAAAAYIDAAIAAALDGRAAAVATAPIHKEALRLGGCPHPGHTEIFAAATGAARVCMILVGPDLAVSFVTVHVGYADVPAGLTVERIGEVIDLTAETIGRLLGRAARIGVCGLNPHAGEHGLFGRREEQRLIAPAVDAARRRGIDLTGPWPADAIFTPEQRARYDAIVCMYHDQGHIPFKMLAFDTGVNVTAGLPIVRTSVDHGTAFDIAWTGRARPTSLIQAILLGVRLAEGRRP